LRQYTLRAKENIKEENKNVYTFFAGFFCNLCFLAKKYVIEREHNPPSRFYKFAKNYRIKNLKREDQHA
jgi:hypothetical protein